MNANQMFSCIRSHTLRFGANGVLPAIVGSVILAFYLSDCQSQQTPAAGYSCGDPTTNSHCYTVVKFSKGAAIPSQQCAVDQTSYIFGYRTSISVTDGMSAGNGFINDELWLNAWNGFGWIEAGYIDDFLGQHYFWAEQDGTSGIFVVHDLAAVPTADFSNYAVVEIFATGADLTTATSFTVNIKNMATNFSQTGISNSMWSGGSPPRSALASFGQELAGTSGAMAAYVFFVNNSWMDSNGHWRLQTADEVPTVDSPPFGGWVQTPCSAAQSGPPNGGAFLTHCCTP